MILEITGAVIKKKRNLSRNIQGNQAYFRRWFIQCNLFWTSRKLTRDITSKQTSINKPNAVKQQDCKFHFTCIHLYFRCQRRALAVVVEPNVFKNLILLNVHDSLLKHRCSSPNYYLPLLTYRSGTLSNSSFFRFIKFHDMHTFLMNAVDGAQTVLTRGSILAFSFAIYSRKTH